MPRTRLTPTLPLCLLLLSCQSPALVRAAQSLQLRPGVQGSFTLPQQQAFQALGNFRVELRMAGFTACPVNYTGIWAFGPLEFRCFLAGGSELNVQDSAASRGVVIPMAGRSDVLIRFQRRIASGSIDVELWDTVTGQNYKFLTASGASTSPVNVAGTTQTVGGSQTTVDLAWIRWSSTLLPAGSPPPSIASGAGDLAYWPLNGNLSDQGPRGLNASISGASWAMTPVYPPVAVIRPENANLASMPEILVVRAGQNASFDASGSYGLDEDQPSIRFAWRQTDGPTQITWEDAQTARPAATGTVFGQYAVRVTVLDAVGRSSHKDITFGVVATDARDLIEPSDPLVKTVFGPSLRWGTSPWPYLDDRHKALADHFGLQLSVDPNLQDGWALPLGGTVTVTRDSAIVTGTGTDFKNDFCNGETQPTTQLVIWYPYYNGQFGRREYSIQHCDSPTQLTLTSPYITSSSAGSLNYSRFLCNACWYNGSNNVNYYDNVMAFYSLYYRTGFTKYLTFAQTLADRWWTMPAIDEGRTCTFGDSGPRCPPPRVLALTGLMWRAHEGRPEMWPGIRLLLDYANSVNTDQLIDTREQGYQLAFLSLGALLDPEQAERTRRQDQVRAILQRIWKAKQNSLGVWDNATYGYESGNTNPPTTVTATLGSNILVGNGTAGYWPTDTKGNWVLLSGDSRAYYTVQGSDNLHLILDRPYLGNSRTTTYQLNNLVGRGTQPFTLGIAANGFYYAYAATEDPLAKEFLLSTAFWLKRFGVRPATRGLYYGRFYLPCEPEPDLAPNCSNGPPTLNGVTAADRYLNGEVIGSVARAFSVSGGDTELLRLGDDLMAAALGRDGGPGKDADYARELDDTILYNKAKNFGFFFGFGASPTWAAARLNRPSQPEGKAALLTHPNASPATLTVFDPRSGLPVTQACSAPPCLVQTNPAGNLLFRLSYQNGNLGNAQSVLQPIKP